MPFAQRIPYLRILIQTDGTDRSARDVMKKIYVLDDKEIKRCELRLIARGSARWRENKDGAEVTLQGIEEFKSYCSMMKLNYEEEIA